MQCRTDHFMLHWLGLDSEAADSSSSFNKFLFIMKMFQVVWSLRETFFSLFVLFTIPKPLQMLSLCSTVVLKCYLSSWSKVHKVSQSCMLGPSLNTKYLHIKSRLGVKVLNVSQERFVNSALCQMAGSICEHVLQLVRLRYQ